MSDAITGAALAISLLALLISSLGLREARKANLLPTVITLFAQYREPDMIQARRTLSQGLSKGLLEFDKPCALHDLPDDTAKAALKVANYLDNVGLLRKRGLIKLDIVVDFMGGSAERIWDELREFVEIEREGRPNG